MIIKSDYRIPSALDGYGLLLRNKHLNDKDHRFPNRAVLFVHGATYGASDTFDYVIDGQSWMDRLAAEGVDAWCLDLLGYGGSDRPAVMSEPADSNAPVVDTAHAVAEVDRAVSFILQERQIERVDLIGYSWGSVICGTYAGRFPEKVGSLVLSGALWLEGLTPPDSPSAPLGAYRTVTIEAMLERWALGLEPAAIDRIVSETERRRWCEQTASCDPDFETTGLLRAPTGVMQDYLHFRGTGTDWYDPGLIQAPVQIVVGELDRETTPAQGQRLFARLSSASARRCTVIGGGTHSLLLENQRHELYGVVSAFLHDHAARTGGAVT